MGEVDKGCPDKGYSESREIQGLPVGAFVEGVDRSFSTEVNSHIMKIIYDEDRMVLLGVFKHQHLYFCKRDLRTPARVIM
jgi:hypothetical protein